MRVYSGNSCFCDVGIPTGETDTRGNKLFTGDVVQLWYGDGIGTENEEWSVESDISVVVSNQHRDSSVDNQPYTMGIEHIGVSGEGWKVLLIKSHRDVVHGEKIPHYGVHFREENKLRITRETTFGELIDFFSRKDVSEFEKAKARREIDAILQTGAVNGTTRTEEHRILG